MAWVRGGLARKRGGTLRQASLSLKPVGAGASDIPAKVIAVQNKSVNSAIRNRLYHKSVSKDKASGGKVEPAAHHGQGKAAVPVNDQRESTQKQQELVQRMQQPIQRKNNATGLPDKLKSGIESLSGMAMDDVRVQYNSAKPAQLQAHAYAQGNQIHIAPGQEKHLPHEAWHVVQQKQGRVKPTLQMKGAVKVNDDSGLEKEADVMGAKAMGGGEVEGIVAQKRVNPKGNVAQLGKISKEEKEKRRARALEKLERGRRRNANKKAKPKRVRHLFHDQRIHNYGYRAMEIFRRESGSSNDQQIQIYNPSLNPNIKPQYSQISIGGSSGYFRQGWGNQPFLYLQSDQYDDKMIPSDYDEIIGHFKGMDPEIAMELLQMIEEGKESGKDKIGQAKSLMMFLTQFVEPHNSRIPGSDKLARALLRRIAMGQLTFQEAFNRKDGLFVSAWAKKAKAPKGGQVAGRTLFGMEPKKNDKFSRKELEEHLGEEKFESLMETVDEYYSEDSDEESDDIQGDDNGKNFQFSFKENSSANVFQVELVNKYLKVLSLPTLNGPQDWKVFLSMEGRIKKQYRSMIKVFHPDKVQGEQAKMINKPIYMELTEAFTHLGRVLNLVREKGGFAAENAIDIHLAQLGFDFHPIEGDGNCFFSAIQDQLNYLNHFQVNGGELRGRIAQLIIDNADEFRVFVVGGILDNLVNQILTNQNWNNQGGDFAPQLMASVLRRQVMIITPGGIRTIDPRNDLILTHNNTMPVHGAPLVIVYNGMNHYDSTRRKMIGN